MVIDSSLVECYGIGLHIVYDIKKQKSEIMKVFSEMQERKQMNGKLYKGQRIHSWTVQRKSSLNKYKLGLEIRDPMVLARAK